MLHVHKSKNFLIILIGSLFLLVLGFFVLNNYIYQEKQGDSENIVPYKAQLTGEYICLPHRNTTGPTTMECAFGLMTNSGEYYAVDFGADNTGMPEFIAGQKVTLEGMVTPVEMLSTDYWQKYDIKGILSVTSQTEPSPRAGEDYGDVFCTMDAMECPDGSFVGRVPPSCNFAPCPEN